MFLLRLHEKISEPFLDLNMRPSLFLNLLLVATVALFLMIMPAAYEARRILHGEEQNLPSKRSLLVQGPVPTISLPNTWRINQKIITGDHINASPWLRRHLLRSPVPPSAPNPRTGIPASAATRNVAAPSEQGSLQKSPVSHYVPSGDTSIP